MDELDAIHGVYGLGYSNLLIVPVPEHSKPAIQQIERSFMLHYLITLLTFLTYLITLLTVLTYLSTLLTFLTY